MVIEFTERPGISTELLLSKAEFGIFRGTTRLLEGIKATELFLVLFVTTLQEFDVVLLSKVVLVA